MLELDLYFFLFLSWKVTRRKKISVSHILEC